MPGQKKRTAEAVPNPFPASAVIILPRIFKPLKTPLLQYIGTDRNSDGTGKYAKQDNDKSKWERLFHLFLQV